MIPAWSKMSARLLSPCKFHHQPAVWNAHMEKDINCDTKRRELRDKKKRETLQLVKWYERKWCDMDPRIVFEVLTKMVTCTTVNGSTFPTKQKVGMCRCKILSQKNVSINESTTSLATWTLLVLCRDNPLRSTDTTGCSLQVLPKLWVLEFCLNTMKKFIGFDFDLYFHSFVVWDDSHIKRGAYV